MPGRKRQKPNPHLTKLDEEIEHLMYVLQEEIPRVGDELLSLQRDFLGARRQALLREHEAQDDHLWREAAEKFLEHAKRELAPAIAWGLLRLESACSEARKDAGPTKDVGAA